MTELIRRPAAVVYDRVAGVYDWYTAPMEALGGRRARRRVLARAHGRVLELGIGTGLNLAHYSPGVELTGIDISPRMLDRARQRAARLGVTAVLEVADIEALPYPDASFDTVTATCVFCSVDDPVRGLREAARVVRPDGQVLLYEHVRPHNPVLAKLTDLVSPLTRRLFGPELNRPTERNVEAAGLSLAEVHRQGIWREIVAPSQGTGEHQPNGAASALRGRGHADVTAAFPALADRLLADARPRRRFLPDDGPRHR